MKILVAVFLGGGLGSISRYLLSRLLIQNYTTSFPLGTLIVNVLGCFLIGVILTIPEKYSHQQFPLKMFLATGFCGGFTTFSAFTYENNVLIHNKEFFYATLYTILSFALGMLATYLGIVLAKKIF